MGYAVKEIFYSIQGEGYHAGRPTIFCRFAGCNLWSGLEKHRSTAQCRFCDTDFVGTDGTFGGKYSSAIELAEQLKALWPEDSSLNAIPYLVFTGGEPTLQIDAQLIHACKDQGFEIGIETNGTKVVPDGIDWVCVSPKPRSTLLQCSGHELKLVFPQPEENMHPKNFQGLDFSHWYLQPMAGTDEVQAIKKTWEYCLMHPQWKLSIQMHKVIGVR